MVDYWFFVLLLPFCYGDVYKKGNKIGVLSAKNPDNSMIERLCGAVYDVNCVRDYFYEHSKCKKTYGPVPEPYVRNEMTLYLPSLNLSVTSFNLQIAGLNSARIDEFYVNKETNNVVLAIEFQNLNMTINRSLFRFHRRAREPIVTEAPDIVDYTTILMTIVIPNIKDLQLERAEYTTFLDDFVPPFGVSPQAAGSTDPQVAATTAMLALRPEVNVQEYFLSDSVYYPLQYIQHNICDFGIKVL